MPKVVGRLPFFFVPSPLSPPQLCTGGWHSLLPLRPFAVALVLPTLYPWSSWCRWEHEETIGNHWAAKCDSTCFIGFGWIWFKRQSTGFSLVFGGDWDWLGLVTRLPSHRSPDAAQVIEQQHRVHQAPLGMLEGPCGSNPAGASNPQFMADLDTYQILSQSLVILSYIYIARTYYLNVSNAF
jgi:hypothetical protein